MSFVNRLISSNAIGNPTSYLQVFSDLEEVGNWPSKENIIIKITKVEIWYNASRINGIKATYLIPGDNTKTEMHGSELDQKGEFELTGYEFIVGAFGAVKTDDNALKRLGFVVYNSATGEMSIKGPYPSPSGSDSVKGFSFQGYILGFGGTLSDDNLLDAIVFYKATDSDTTTAISG